MSRVEQPSAALPALLLNRNFISIVKFKESRTSLGPDKVTQGVYIFTNASASCLVNAVVLLLLQNKQEEQARSQLYRAKARVIAVKERESNIVMERNSS